MTGKTKEMANIIQNGYNTAHTMILTSIAMEISEALDLLKDGDPNKAAAKLESILEDISK